MYTYGVSVVRAINNEESNLISDQEILRSQGSRLQLGSRESGIAARFQGFMSLSVPGFAIPQWLQELQVSEHFGSSASTVYIWQ